MKIELTVLENSIESLNEAFRQYRLGIDTVVHLKFSVMLFAQFIELLQFHIIRTSGISNAKKVEFHEGTKILLSATPPLPSELGKSIDAIRRQRNNMQHNKVTYLPYEIRRLMSSILSGLCEYAEQFDIKIKKMVEQEHLLLFIELIDEKATLLSIANDMAFRLSPNNQPLGCYECGENEVASIDEYRIMTCHNCGHEEHIET